ncbi:MAG: Nif3-like dinuclear metal center hexameric protein, partial [Acetomicrobium sp.]
CGGSGGNLWINAANFNVDLYITADMKYHQIAEAQQRLNIALVDHGQMERSGLSKFIKDLQQSLEIQVHDLTDIKVYSPPRIISFD